MKLTCISNDLLITNLYQSIMNNTQKILTTLLSSAAVLMIAPPAHAGCGDAKGLIRICYKDICEIQKMIRACSSVGSGSHWISDMGYQVGYSNPIGERYTNMEIRKYHSNTLLYSGDPDASPWKFEVCGNDRGAGATLCSNTSWAKK